MDAPARIIDANANRAREGLRTLEDLARFALNDGALARVLKEVRHDLASAVASLPASPAALADARDTPGDVGTAVSTASEGARAGLGPVAAAAGGRAGEALRVLEEVAKALGAGGRPFEALRYRLYDAERGVRLGLGRRAPQWTLCVVVTASACAGRDPVRVAEAAIAGGADCVQVREKTLDGRALVDLTRAVVELARPRGVAVIVNDRADVALAAGADGVHLGQTDLRVGEARRVVGEGAIVGVSASTLEQARRAAGDGASYLGLGSAFASLTKPKPELAGVALVRAVVGDAGLGAVPHLAIGGITAANAGELAAAGCRGVAVCGAVCGAEDPAAACGAIVGALRGGVSPRRTH